MTDDSCSVADCQKPSFARGICRMHLSRIYRLGTTDLPPHRPPTNNRPVRSLADRFWIKVEKTDTCWLWHGGKTVQGYGSIWSGPRGRHLMAHRVSWELHNGRPLRNDEQIDHLCRQPSCVRPDHLEAVTVAENTRRGYAPSLGAAFQLAKTHCPQGHPYDEANTYRTKAGARMCRACIRIRSRAQRAARRDGATYVDPFLLDRGD